MVAYYGREYAHNNRSGTLFNTHRRDGRPLPELQGNDSKEV
jgi:hypothetical protein